MKSKTRLAVGRCLSARVTFAACTFALASAFALAATRPAAAQETDQHIQLSLSSNLFAYESHRLSSGDSHVSITDTTFGPAATGLGLDLGFGPTPRWLVGARLLGTSTRSGNDQPGSHDAHSWGYSVLPRAEYLLFPGEPVAPYFGATFGVRGSSSSSGPGTKVASTDLVIGAVAGVRSFVAPGFSIDPGITVLASTGNQRLSGADFERTGLSVMLGVSFSGWLDVHSAQSAPKKQTPPEPAPNTQPADAVKVETDDDGTVRSRFVFADRRQLQLVGRPIHQGNEVLVTLILPERREKSLANCSEVAVVVDGTRRVLSHARNIPPAESSIEAIITPTLLRSLGRANETATFLACDSEWQVAPSERSAILDFVAHFREIAERYGQWPEGATTTPRTRHSAAR